MKKSIVRNTLPLMRAVTINFVETPISRFFLAASLGLVEVHGFTKVAYSYGLVASRQLQFLASTKTATRFLFLRLPTL